MPVATKQVSSLPWQPAVLRKHQLLPQETQQQHVQEQRVVCEQRECGLKMEESGGASHRSAREGNPLLPGKEKARKRSMLMSIKDDIGKGVIYNIRLSRWYLAYCSLMAILTLSLVIFMIVDIHFWKNPVPAWVCALDGFMTFAVCFETVVDVILLGGPFWSSGWHVFDFAVSLVCFISWVLLLLEVVRVVEPLEGFVTVILLTIRYAAQFIRIVRFIRTGAEAQDSLTAVEEQVIRFDSASGSRAEAGGRSAAAVPSGGLDP
ncbi:hypothetical protein Esti_004509 [Eimeria stiedai]